jgi:flagellar hook-basal body complex protein FliE
MVKDAIGSVIESGKKSDGQSQAMAAGKANIVDVATAVTETEVAIEAMVSVRDKVIAAYEEIMRMPI